MQISGPRRHMLPTQGWITFLYGRFHQTNVGRNLSGQGRRDLAAGPCDLSPLIHGAEHNLPRRLRPSSKKYLAHQTEHLLAGKSLAIESQPAVDALFFDGTGPFGTTTLPALENFGG